MAFVLDVAGDNEALVARNETGITDVAGLRGKRVATAFASTAHYSLLAALQQALGVGRPARRPAAAGVAGRVGAG